MAREKARSRKRNKKSKVQTCRNNNSRNEENPQEQENREQDFQDKDAEEEDIQLEDLQLQDAGEEGLEENIQERVAEEDIQEQVAEEEDIQEHVAEEDIQGQVAEEEDIQEQVAEEEFQLQVIEKEDDVQQQVEEEEEDVQQQVTEGEFQLQEQECRLQEEEWRLQDEEWRLQEEDEADEADEEDEEDEADEEDEEDKEDEEDEEEEEEEEKEAQDIWDEYLPTPGSEKEPGIISTHEYNDIMAHQLYYEKEPKPENPITGNRIVELGYVLDWAIRLQYNHSKICTLGMLSIAEERRHSSGLTSTVVFKCSVCSREYEHETENPNREKSVANIGAVWGTLATGSTCSHLNENLACMDIPTMSSNLFYNIETEVGKEWEASLVRSMERAGIKEKERAIEEQHLCSDGTPWITVCVDGSWSKRSYGTNYNALSGMVAIIGKHTGQVLFIAVRNKFCAICARAANANVVVKKHTCYKNWDQSAPAMEADMVVEGFNCSESMHGVRYSKFIADGDSSVYKNIIEKVSYGNEVKKIECTNHALKNYGKRLREIKKDTRIKLEGRKLLTFPIIKLLQKRAKTSIYEHAKQEIPDVDLLRKDLRNGLHHVFGNHSSCRAGICNSVGEIADNMIPRLQSTSIFDHLNGALDILVRKAHLLIENQNNNAAEAFMNIVARFNEGKRLNLVQRGSYLRRVNLAGLRYNANTQWHTSPYKNVTGMSPGVHFKKFLSQESNAYEKRKCRKRLFPKATTEPSNNERQEPATKTRKTTINVDYGPNAEQPENSDIMKLEVAEILQRLQVTVSQRDLIQTQTVGQFGNDEYVNQRKSRLTASLFGQVIKRRTTTPCHSLVKTVLKRNYFMTEATEYGIVKEKVAKSIFEQIQKVVVVDSGLWVDVQHGYLGASPDGLVNDDALLEIKCLHSASKLILQTNTISEIIDVMKNTICLEKHNNKIQLKRNHNYYYQIQGQLNITNRSRCYFVVYVSDTIDLYIEEIEKDSKLWVEKMLPKLQQFYTECIAPEIVRDRISKGLKCIDPPYINQAILEQEAKKNKRTKKNPGN